ncbi:MAG: nucleotidyltransferase family protein [Planctomycetota bacterium]|nr:nucleotidyltransferase family protein [Planctomycetota bacterium]
MPANRRNARTAGEQAAPYGATAAKVDVMPSALLDVGVRYMQELKEKARSVSQALSGSGVSHAVIGGLALAAHLAKASKLAERNTQDLDILLNREDLEKAKEALDPLGYRFRRVMKLHAFMPKRRGAHFVEGVHVIWAGEKVRDEYLHPAPALGPAAMAPEPDGVCYLSLTGLLTMKLTSFRHKDITHVQDLLYWKLITKKVEAALPPDLRERLEQVKEETKREQLG